MCRHWDTEWTLISRPCCPFPTTPGCGFLSVLRSPEGEAQFVESAILISQTELLGFFSLVREEES